MSVPTSKARIILALTTTQQDNAPFYKPGERAAGPLAVFTRVDQGTGAIGLLTIKQGSRYIRQDKRPAVSLETLATAPGGTVGPFAGTAAQLAIAPGSLVIKTHDDSGFDAGVTDEAGCVSYADNKNGVITNATTPPVVRGSVNYFTGAVSVTFPNNVNAGAVQGSYTPVERFEEGVAMFKIDGFQKELPLEIGGQCSTGSLQVWVDLVGQWM